MLTDLNLQFHQLREIDVYDLLSPRHITVKSLYIDCLSIINDIVCDYGSSIGAGHFHNFTEPSLLILKKVREISPPQKLLKSELSNQENDCVTKFASIVDNLLQNLKVALDIVYLFGNHSEIVRIGISDIYKTNHDTIDRHTGVGSSSLLTNIKNGDQVYHFYKCSNEIIDKEEMTSSTRARQLVNKFISELLHQYGTIIIINRLPPNDLADGVDPPRTSSIKRNGPKGHC